MIVSHEHKFIFVKTKKTAGTSVEIGLSKYCGARDVITPISPGDEKLRAELGHRGAQHYRVPLSMYDAKDWARLLARGRAVIFYNHMPAKDIRKYIGTDVWNSYFKFCIERNPWDKVISWYYWRHPKEPRPTLSEFIQSGEANLVGGPGGFDMYTIDGEIVVDKVCLYENLEEELKAVRERLNLPGPITLPRAKGGVRTEKRHYRDVLNEADRSKIAKVFAREIAYFGYTY